MIHKDSTDNTNTVNTAKSNSHNHTQNANIEPYSDFMDNMEYFSLYGFLLSRMAYELVHDK